MTLRIFFWSNFFGRPWTVVNVLRPFRSNKIGTRQCYLAMRGGSRGVIKRSRDGKGERTLNTNMDVVLTLLGLASVFVSFGEGVYQ